jgi:hypothetical protein
MPQFPRNPTRAIPPAVALSVCIARALHEADPKFLPALRSSVRDFRQSHHYATRETLDQFLEVLDDPEIFVRGGS